MSTPPVYEVFFTGKDDPRDGAIVIGFEDTKPQFFRFETTVTFMGNTRTTVYRDAGDDVAWLDWTAGNNLGSVTIHARQSSSPMLHFVMHGSVNGSRAFLSADGRHFEWRRCADDPYSYDLWASSRLNPSTRIASYRRSNQNTPVGPSYAFLSYIFNNDYLLLEALIALSINRWLDWRGMQPNH